MTAEEYLNALPPECQPLVARARKWVGTDDRVDPDGVVCICRLPEVAPEAYLFRFYPPVDEVDLARVPGIPEPYRRYLALMNGCFAYRLSLYGFASALRGPALLDRTRLRPLDLRMANDSWKDEYRGSDKSWYHFGGRSYTDRENVGYFLDGDGRVRCRRKNGGRAGEWDDFASFLAAELDAAASRHASTRNAPS